MPCPGQPELASVAYMTAPRPTKTRHAPANDDISQIPALTRAVCVCVCVCVCVWPNYVLGCWWRQVRTSNYSARPGIPSQHMHRHASRLHHSLLTIQRYLIRSNSQSGPSTFQYEQDSTAAGHGEFEIFVVKQYVTNQKQPNIFHHPGRAGGRKK